MKHAMLIAQAHARDGSALVRQAGDALQRRGISIVGSHVEHEHAELRKRVRDAVKSNVDLVVAIGGDGTQTIAVSELAHSKSVLAVMPGGTGNSFAESLGIMNPRVACDTIEHGRVARVDVGRIGRLRFANFATIGLASVIGENTPRWLKERFGPLAYGLAAVKPMFTQRPFRAHVKWKKNRLKLHTQQILVVNGRMYGHTPITPDSTLTDGLLTFFATSSKGPVDAIKTYLSFLNDSQTSLPEAHIFRAKKLTIKTSRRVRISVDGVVAGKTPATFSVEPEALSVLVPHDEHP